MTGNTERPLISLTMFVYNQEDFILEALEGAFDQTYQPLEIIISDDCSTDRTYEIIKSKAETYHGPHQLRVRQNSCNLGIAEHVNQIIDSSRGEIIVLAAGDDISHPERVKRTEEAFRNENISLVHSSVVCVDNQGKELENASVKILLDQPRPIPSVAKSMSLYIGATGAIKRSLYEKYGKIFYGNAFEDLVYGFRAALEGEYKYIDEPLVRYRIGAGESTTVNAQKNASVESKRALKSLIVRIDVLKQRLADTKISGVDKPFRLVWMIRLNLYRTIAKYALLRLVTAIKLALK